MATYKEAGVNITEGDKASAKAYRAAMDTFSSRKGMIGAPILLEGGFAGALDFGSHYLVLGCDGVGTKIEIALETGIWEGMGYDLLAMVSDDAVCVGAELIAITNTIDTHKVSSREIEMMMDSLSKACQEHHVVIPGGEIAELGNTLTRTIWNASAVGIVEKEKYITGEKIKPGDAVISLYEPGFRSNGFSLVRYICEREELSYRGKGVNGKTWGELLLTPSTIFHSAVLKLIGRYGEKKRIEVGGIAHITGGGLAGNLSRILKKSKVGALLPDIWEPSEMVRTIQKIGGVGDDEAYRTWNMGNGMLIVVSDDEKKEALSILRDEGISAKIAGEITEEPEIIHTNHGAMREKTGKNEIRRKTMG